MSTTDSRTSQFERALTQRSAPGVRLRLFVAGMTPRSTDAVADLKRLSDEFFGPQCTAEVVDIYEHPQAATEAQVIAVPTLMRTFPLPQRKLVGSIRDIANVARTLGLTPRQPEPSR